MQFARIPHAQTRKANRDLLLSAARRVFATAGFDAASIRKIVCESGLTQGSFYNNFNDKQAIFEVVLDDIVEPIILLLRSVRAQSKTAEEFLWSAFDVCACFPIENPETSAIIARNQSAFRLTFYLGGNNAQIRKDLIADLKEGMVVGQLRHFDAKFTADAMISLGLDLVIQIVIHPEEAQSRVQYLTDLFMGMISPK